ncbi:MAG TPA: DUF3536 domain-containing protein, partial [Candidatus Omnitrophota bacterium]|nr:DUF3536 domain-containing protein [Candidatus Omnitrophota bacterium]
SGHGSAIAQAYNHMIMPLANRRDKETQVLWGIKDFEHRFKRKPEGMWLPETAVDLETLEVLAENNIKFTILSASQALRVKDLDQESWQDVNNGGIDPQIPYVCRLASGKTIALFFYNGAVAQEVAFGGLLHDGEIFANRLIDSFPKTDTHETRLSHIATDGETYGHHHHFGDMALAYCLQYIQSKNLAQVTIYGEFLEKFPPKHEVEIIKNTSWSCPHGIERWRANCGCRLKEHPGSTQEWRKHLRLAMDWLRGQLIPVYEKEISPFLADPWLARNDYIDVILWGKYSHKTLNPQDKIKVLKLFEIQRHAMLMYTSCGWFFDDTSGIETIQILQYAARAMQLTKELTGLDLEEDFMEFLKTAPSHNPEFKNGKEVYERFVTPARIDLLSVAAHYALTSLFENYPALTKNYSYALEREFYECKESGPRKLALGRVQVHSLVTDEKNVFSFAVLHQGDDELTAGVIAVLKEDLFKEMEQKIKSAFAQGNVPLVLNLMRQYFGTREYSLLDVFRGEQENILNRVLNPTFQGTQRLFHRMYPHPHRLIHVKKDKRISLPKTLAATVEFILNRDLQIAVAGEPLDLDRMQKIVKELKRWSFEVDKGSLSYLAGRKFNRLMRDFYSRPEDLTLLKTIAATLRIFQKLPGTLDVWRSVNMCFLIDQKITPSMKKKADAADPDAREWLKCFDGFKKRLEKEDT